MINEYVPSKQVDLLIKMVIDYRYRDAIIWNDNAERRFHGGVRHGLNLAFRNMVELETGLTDSDELDELCSDLLTDAIINTM